MGEACTGTRLTTLRWWITSRLVHGQRIIEYVGSGKREIVEVKLVRDAGADRNGDESISPKALLLLQLFYLFLHSLPKTKFHVSKKCVIATFSGSQE